MVNGCCGAGTAEIVNDAVPPSGTLAELATTLTIGTTVAVGVGVGVGEAVGVGVGVAVGVGVGVGVGVAVGVGVGVGVDCGINAISTLSTTWSASALPIPTLTNFNVVATLLAINVKW
jgi:hypothetical protein